MPEHKLLSTTNFRAELKKAMPGHKWTVHRSNLLLLKGELPKYIAATGIQTAGLNRMSTIEVDIRYGHDGHFWYTVRSSGFGMPKRATDWLGEEEAPTLLQALRNLQTFYQDMAANYSCHAGDIESGRPKKGKVTG